MSKRLYEHLKSLTTEQRNRRSDNLDRIDIAAILKLINREDSQVPAAVAKVLPQIAAAVEMITSSFRTGGRLIYAGAGTSGRLGVLDAAECPPTFGVPAGMVCGIIAGGRGTLVRSREGVEDDAPAAVRDIEKLKPRRMDTVVGIAASGRTPYPLAVLKRAKRDGATTVFLVCNELPRVPAYVDILINPILGPEVLTGSTRMKAGTACKMILNMLSTAAMVQIGKCYGNLMVDLRATSEKLTERSKRILVETTGVSYQQASRLLKRSRGEVKTAIVMQLAAVDCLKAKQLLADAGGKLSLVLQRQKRTRST
jgi:N-acetylmuramic acid 6-phosphate etherase